MNGTFLVEVPAGNTLGVKLSTSEDMSKIFFDTNIFI